MPTASPHYRIGEAARQSGVSAANIRYYEKEGLLAAPGRGENSYRTYTDADLHQLRFIRMCRAMDMSLDEVRALLRLDLRREADCAIARETLDGHLAHVRARQAELNALAQDLRALRQRCDGHDGGHCGIIEALHERAEAQAVVTTSTPSAAGRRHV
ncbi:MAG: Cd(II)/Pb(II)-responsive transcriptional regulator [Lysobacteraceae bacterium]|nr:MAG: Cd(II)/Pb(II)-responsive transcriptional regulator [Xanthomonadaceae bacterium]